MPSWMGTATWGQSAAGRSRPRSASSRERLCAGTGCARMGRRGSAGASGSQQVYGLLVGELLACHAGDEAPAAELAPCLEAAQGPEDLPPRNAQPLLEIDVAEHHAPPQQQLPGDGFSQLLDVVDRFGGRQQRP